MDIHSSHDVKFTISRRRADGTPQPLYLREQFGTADLGDGVVLRISQSLNRMAFFVENDTGDTVVFQVKHLIEVAAHILVHGHPAEREGGAA